MCVFFLQVKFATSLLASLAGDKIVTFRAVSNSKKQKKNTEMQEIFCHNLMIQWGSEYRISPDIKYSGDLNSKLILVWYSDGR